MSALFGQTQTFSQLNGPDVQLRVQGDEFYARNETLDGSTAVYDGMLGLYCYANLVDGEFVSTGASLSTSMCCWPRRRSTRSQAWEST